MKMLHQIPLALIASTWMANLPTATVQAGPEYYRITLLDPLEGGASSHGRGLNDLGQVVGFSRDAQGVSRAVLWEDGQARNLGVPDPYANSTAWDVNDSGQGSGRATGGPGGASSGIVHDGAGWSVAGTFGVARGNAFGINDTGTIVGNARLPSGDFSRAYAWTPDGGTVHLGTFLPDPAGFGGFRGASYAVAINDLGQVVGSSGPDDGHTGDHAFLWDAAGGMRDLGTPAGYNLTFAQGINNLGQVVGQANVTLDGATRPFLWSEETGMTSLGTLGGDRGFAFAINDLGQVVGGAANSAGNTRAFLWQGGVMTDLNTLLPTDSGWTLTAAYGINGSGQVVGEGLYRGQTRAFLLTAVPEPTSFLLVSTGLIGTTSLGIRRTRRRGEVDA